MCQNCGDSFVGRPNRAYCSQNCKSAVNNRSYANRDYEARQVERQVRANRGILSQLYKIFGDKLLPSMVIEQSGLKTQFNSGTSGDAAVFVFLDFAIQKFSNTNYKIFKTT